MQKEKEMDSIKDRGIKETAESRGKEEAQRAEIIGGAEKRKEKVKECSQ